MNILPTDPTTGQSQPVGQSLGDVLGGVDRPKLNAFIAQSQARNGLVSAQTQEAMIKASQAQEEQDAYNRIPQELMAAQPEMKMSEATLARDFMVKSMDSETALKSIARLKLMYGNPQEQAQGQQGFEGKMATPPTVPNNYLPVPGQAGTPGAPAYAGVQPQQTAQGVAQTAETNALAGLNTHKDTAPGDFRNASIFGSTSPEGQAALTTAVHDGRLDPMRINARTAPMLAQIELQAPGTNFNALHAGAALQANPTFQQRAMGLEIMPGILQHLTQLGKQLDDGAGYSDLRTAGKIQQFMNGEFNDPAYAEYMPVRNDAILRLAYLMRGMGASNQAAHMEQEAFAPTLAPYALDAWLKGQMSVLKPMIEKNNSVRQMGQPGAPSLPGVAPTGAAPEAAPPPAATNKIFPDEASARRAGMNHASGEITIGGVKGTLD